MSRRPPSASPTDSPAVRLEQYLRAKACIPYEENMPDREYPYITCSIYGVPRTNELFVRLTNGSVTFVDVVASPVAYPTMADRVFGIDVVDSSAALGLADKLWDAHREALVRKPDDETQA